MQPTLFERHTTMAGGSRSATAPDRILVIKLSSIGDVVQALPVATALRRNRPDRRITWAAEEWTAPLVVGHPSIDRVVVFPRMSARSALASPARWIREYRRAVSELRAERYDLVLDLQGLLKSSVVVLLSRASRRLGIEGQREGARLVSPAVSTGRGRVPAVQEYLRAAEHLGADPEPVVFDLPVQTEARETIARRLAQLGIRDEAPLVVVNPAGATGAKSPPPNLWAEIVGALSSHATVALVGAPSESAVHVRITRAAPGTVHDLTGQTTLPALVALLERAAVHVAPDTGSAHIAAALGRPVIGLYGPTPPARLAPWRQNDLLVHHREACGRFCPNLCRQRPCLRQIRPAEVVEKTLRALGRT